MLMDSPWRFKVDGLSTLTYIPPTRENHQLYTRILVRTWKLQLANNFMNSFCDNLENELNGLSYVNSWFAVNSFIHVLFYNYLVVGIYENIDKKSPMMFISKCSCANVVVLRFFGQVVTWLIMHSYYKRFWTLHSLIKEQEDKI